MEYKRLLLGAASFLAVGAAVTQPGNAKPNPGPTLPRVESQSSGLLFGLILHTGGTLTVESIESGIAALLPDLTPDQAKRLPDFMTDLSGLGLSAPLEDAARQALVDRVYLAALDDGLRDSLVARLAVSSSPYLLAQNTLPYDGFCDPRNPRDPDCPPNVTGTLGGYGA